MSTENLVETTESAGSSALVADVATEENPITAMLKAKAKTLEAIGNAISKNREEEKTSAFNLASKLAGIADNEENRFKGLMQTLGLYQVIGNSEEITKLEADIAMAKTALLAAGFSEDSDIVKGAIKSLSGELEKSRKSTKDNMSELAAYFGVKLASKHSPHASTGELAMKRYTAADIQKADWLVKDGEKTMVVCHSSTLAGEELAKVGIDKPASETYVTYFYNGDLQYNRVKTNVPGESEAIATVTNWPSAVLEIKPFKFELDSLAGFEKACLIHMRGLKPTDAEAQKISRPGWQSVSKLAEPFKMVQRVIRTNG